jgi:cellobiose phosphorylase
MQFGYFDDVQREYVITNPKTPVKWINYIGTLEFGGFVDHTGGALICQGDPTFNRITKYLPQLPAADFKGETLFLRIHQPEGYRVFSPFFTPTLDDFDLFECHVGLGYTRLVSEFYGLRCEATIFVPREEQKRHRTACEIRDFRITNLTGQPIEVDAIPVVEYTHPDALKQFTNADWIPQTMQSRAVHEEGRVVLVQYPFMRRDLRINYFTSNLPASSFETDRARFLGEYEYSGWVNPRSLQAAELSNYEAQRGDNIGALLHPLGILQPGETRRLITQLGQADNLEGTRASIQRFRQPEQVEASLAELAAFWEAYLDKLQVHTPDAAMNSMLNIHNPRQCYTTLTWSRYLSLYQLGLGSRGIGYRDSSQDVLAVLTSAPQEAKALLLKLLSIQKRDGSAMHQFNPLTMEGSTGDSAEREDRPHYYSDDHLWIILAVCAYLKETGDFDFLDETIPFYDKDKAGQPIETGTVLEHLKRALVFTIDDTGRHGLPHLGFADWNDTVNLPKGAESLFTANLYGVALQEMIGLARQLGDETAARAFRIDYETMRQRVEQNAWDGEWYVRYFDNEGAALGSNSDTHGKIYLNGQTWPVISGFASPERARQALEAVYRRLNTPKGIKLSTPGFNGFDPSKGGVTTYPPGAKENGGIFLHPNPWAMIAETRLGNGDRAYEYYRQINPAAKNDVIEEFECEPYVYPQNILGDEHPQFGLARNSWLSGTAAWSYVAATQHILGLRPEYSGLRVDPCIPARWDGFTAERVFRGVRYRITVHNPNHVCRGIKEMIVDGQHIAGNILPPALPGEAHQIEVTLEG